MVKLAVFKPTLLRRLFSGYAVIILIITVIISLLISRQISESSLEDLKLNLSVRAHLIAEIIKPELLIEAAQSTSELESELQSKLHSTLQSTIDRLANEIDSRLTVLDHQGNVLADSKKSPALMSNHANRPEIIMARKGENATATHFSQTLQQQMIYYALKIQGNNEDVGYIRVSLSLSTVDEKLSQLKSTVLFSAIIAGVVALIIGFSFFRKVSAPLKSITQVAHAISEGDYSKRLTTSTAAKDEIYELVASFNRIAHSSEERINQISTERNRLEMIFKGMVEGVIYINENVDIIHINQAAMHMLDLPEVSINLSKQHKIEQTEILDAVQQAFQRQSSVEQGVVKTKMHRVNLQNTEQVNEQVIDIYVAALNDDNGSSIGAVIVLNDVSELVYLERVRRDFVANASHELKTPITVIRGITETILDDVDMPAPVRIRFIKKIEAQSLRLSSLVTDLMSVSRLDVTQKQSMPDKINLNNLITTAVSNAFNLSQQNKIKLSNKMINDVLYVEGDNQEVSQLIDNLLNNAINYTPQLGNINISLEVNSDKNQAIIKVADSGIGIEPKYQDRIFERFYRVDKARSRELGGTGLGLSICKHIVDKHNGTIKVCSSVGHGSTFIVTLPIVSSIFM